MYDSLHLKRVLFGVSKKPPTCIVHIEGDYIRGTTSIDRICRKISLPPIIFVRYGIYTIRYPISVTGETRVPYSLSLKRFFQFPFMSPFIMTVTSKFHPLFDSLELRIITTSLNHHICIMRIFYYYMSNCNLCQDIFQNLFNIFAFHILNKTKITGSNCCYSYNDNDYVLTL